MIQLFKGDCLEILKNIPDGSVDLILTDPPYGTTACKWDVIIPFDHMWKELNRVIKPNGAIVLYGSEPFSSLLVASNINNFKHEWIWQKDKGSNFANTVREPMKEHEHILVFCGGKWTYNKQMEERKRGGVNSIGSINKQYKKSLNYGDFKGATFEVSKLRVPSSVQLFKRETGYHPTQKPVALLEYLIKTYTNVGDKVLDFTMGSGSTGVAAVNLGRDFIGIERDDKYFSIAEKRILEAEQNSLF